MGQMGIEEVTGQIPEISEWVDFDLSDSVWWIDKKQPSTMDDNIILGWWLGISQKNGNDMCYWVLMVSGKVIDQTTVNHVIHTNLLDPDMKGHIKNFDEEW